MSPSRVALVTGGSRGIGAAMVHKLQAAGFRVATCARSLESLRESPAEHRFACDVTDVAQVKAGLRGILERLGQLDAVINNAGLAGTNPMDAESDDDLWHRIIATNLHGAYYVSKYSLPSLPDGAGRIVNVGSVLSLRGVPDQTAYCAAKHGVLGLTRSLAHLAAPRRITVNCICPGWTRTEMAEGRREDLGWTREQLEAGVPIGRFIEPEEVAELALYLLSDAAAGITGQALTIDGGALA
jgi:NAD(P)-dependent dehydrogenase (short-subunit alcohol dehydrogenase family)